VFEVGIEGPSRPDAGDGANSVCAPGGDVSRPCWLGVSLTEVGHLFERDRTTVAHACGLVEDRCDDPDFDYRLDHLERAVSSLIDALSMRRGAGDPDGAAA